MKFIIFALIPLILSIGIVPAIPLNVNADYIDEFSLPYVLDPLTHSQIEDCESIHKDFTSLSDSDFYTRYQTNNFAGNCVMLYEGALWDYDGSDRYEKLSERSAELIQEREMELKQSSDIFYVDSKSLTELQIPGTFLFKFKGCTGDQTINVEDISVVSDKESILLVKFAGEEREIQPGVCNELEMQIRADDPSSIKIVIPSLDVEVSANLDNKMKQHGMINIVKGNHHMSFKGTCAPGFASLDEMCVLDDRCGPDIYAGKVCMMDGVMKQYLRPHHQKYAGISVDNIICAEGKHLMFKHHDSSPACVNSSSVEKLKHRGWQTEKPVMACTMQYDPVCGMDGITYGNMCGLDVQHMAMKHTGECVKP